MKNKQEPTRLISEKIETLNGVKTSCFDFGEAEGLIRKWKVKLKDESNI
jgi:hypothetical protein